MSNVKGKNVVRPCLNVLTESVHKQSRLNLSKIKLCDWPNKLDSTSWQVLNTTEPGNGQILIIVLAIIFFCR